MILWLECTCYSVLDSRWDILISSKLLSSQNEECFYWCEPMLGHFLSGPNIQTMPVCAHYCDSWFEACKDDFTCFDNLEEAYLNADGMPNNCSMDSECRKFSDIFVNSRGLCNRLWGPAYVYSADVDNCIVMVFDSSMPNPNFKLTFPSSGSLSLTSNVIQVSAKLLCLLLMYIVAALT